MKTPNSDGEIRPCLSNFKFYIGQTGQEEDNPLLDFNRLKDGSELGIEFTVSGLNRIYINDESNAISLVVLYYERVGQIGFKLNNLWSVELNDKDMKDSYKTFKISLAKVYLDLVKRKYDMYLNYPLIKIITLPGKFDFEKLDEETLSHWMTWSHHNELLCAKIPMIPESEE
ncbi:hypothetical protein A9958_07995 [Staphylococcus simulans]|uniref:hypothetical protein n=1 Tax=Staphylococcus simulans TaxID=1286 RepID=UPI000D0A4A91|nr:hypothetical protein [Staphylococcus simulans]AVO02345.1 hypothetical protein BI282_07985 [Staphylococcus simulans]AVO05291.1 hypothetical protein BI283_07950 [Staphylococcus simulans]AWG18894.1 hypothetical protein A9958_07995 [Staphylococcus simulans]AWI01841.1 hypothetical protein A7X73_07880 [Staphylococcus simulans]PTJ39492.1 hypothetical protein BU024_00380 [Staphylococcus simulans]